MEMEQIANVLRTIVSEELEIKLKPLQDDISEIKLEAKEMKSQLEMLLAETPDDTLAMLKIISGKLDSVAKDIEFTYKKASMNELEINRLKMQ